MTAPTTQTFSIPDDVAAYCRNGAKALTSSHTFGSKQLDLWRENPLSPHYDPEWLVCLKPAEFEALLANVRTAADLLDWLSHFGKNGGTQ